jgi:alkylresorcinol/alkylpyrone synthase
MTTIAGVHGVVAPHSYAQAQITEVFSAVVSPNGQHHGVISRIHEHSRVDRRSLALPLEAYAGLADFGAANDAYIRVGLDLGEQAVRGALQVCGLEPDDVDLIVSTSVTGVAAPSLDARLVARLGLRPDIRRVPMFGLGCVAGAAGIARVHDLLRGDPDGVAVLLAVELCSLTIQRDDTSMANVVASALFGDGAAAVVMVGERRARDLGLTGPTVVAATSRMYPDTERMMGWDVGATGFRIVLSAGVPDVVSTYLHDDVREFLGQRDLTASSVDRWICHPGGPRVLTAMEQALALDDGQLDITWRSLAAVGNLSSVSVLHVLRDTMNDPQTGARPEAGALGLVVALGPGFCSELVLLAW